MKTRFLIIILLMVPLMAEAIIVTDPTLIALNRVNSERAYLEQLLQTVQEKTQVLRLVEQIRQLDNYLERYGNPADIKRLEGAELLQLFLNQQQISKTTGDITAQLEGREVFNPEPRQKPVYRETGDKVLVDGKAVAKRHAALYKPEAAAQRSIVHYREVRSSVFVRRKQLKGAVSRAMVQLKHAKTSSEVQKLSVLMTGLQTELQAIDREIAFAETEATTRMMQNEVQRRIEQKAKIENERARLRQATLNNARTFKIHWEPVLFNHTK